LLGGPAALASAEDVDLVAPALGLGQEGAESEEVLATLSLGTVEAAGGLYQSSIRDRGAVVDEAAGTAVVSYARCARPAWRHFHNLNHPRSHDDGRAIINGSLKKHDNDVNRSTSQCGHARVNVFRSTCRSWTFVASQFYVPLSPPKKFPKNMGHRPHGHIEMHFSS